MVDDGSTPPVPQPPDCDLVRLERNGGKAAALRAGFRRALELGFTHATTMDADGQHFADDLPAILAAAEAQPDALIVGVRNLRACGAPAGRRRSNAVSSFWFRVETGVRLADTQCGFRCYPLLLIRRLKIRSERYAFELEVLVRTAWVGTTLVSVPVRCVYQPEHLRSSHFRPVADLAHITLMNIGLVLQSWLVPRRLRVAWSCGEKETFRKTLRAFFSEHADDPLRLSLATGLGLFFGIAPIWGYQMIVAAAAAHLLRLNKAIALLASNISIPPVMPFILYGALALGHWLFTGRRLELSLDQISRAKAFEYFWQWLAGSVVLGLLVAAAGTAITYIVAVLVRKPAAHR